MVVVGDSVGGGGLGEKNGDLGGKVSGDGEGCAGGEVRVLVDAKRFAVVAGIAAAMKRQKVVGGAEVDAIQ